MRTATDEIADTIYESLDTIVVDPNLSLQEVIEFLTSVRDRIDTSLSYLTQEG